MYFNVCPNCGAVPEKHHRTCVFCGTSLAVPNPQKFKEDQMHSIVSRASAARRQQPAAKKEEPKDNV
jgi:rRNA maturation protein Nop10